MLEEWTHEKLRATWRDDCASIKEQLEQVSNIEDGGRTAAGAATLLAAAAGGDWEVGVTGPESGIVDVLAMLTSSGIDERPDEFPQLARRYFLQAMFTLAYDAGQQSVLSDSPSTSA